LSEYAASSALSFVFSAAYGHEGHRGCIVVGIGVRSLEKQYTALSTG
jgi:hypothetical protein